MATNNKNLVQANTETLCIFNDSRYSEQFCSFSPDNFEGKMKLYNAINSPDERLGNVINMPISIRDVVICKVNLTEKIGGDNEPDSFDDNPFDKRTARQGFRVILLDTDGKSYTATSTGVYNSISTMRSVFGTLHFEDGLKVVVKQIKTKNGNTLTLSITE